MCACEREVCLVAFVCCCFACDCVLELVVCRVRFARVSCPRLRFTGITDHRTCMLVQGIPGGGKRGCRGSNGRGFYPMSVCDF